MPTPFLCLATHRDCLSLKPVHRHRFLTNPYSTTVDKSFPKVKKTDQNHTRTENAFNFYIISFNIMPMPSPCALTFDTIFVNLNLIEWCHTI